MAEYSDAAKKLLSVCTRLQNMFKGSRYYETVQTETTDGIIFRWEYRYGKFEWYEPEKGWQKAVNPRDPSMMARLISVVPYLHLAAIKKKDAVADALDAAASAGEEYLQEFSAVVDGDFAEEETSDYETLFSGVNKP
tara:strand:- start:2765 stop:3175 length:411 start_codon:yes stop_codon:yes gene_type:complete